ncbi:helix-turn-helix transcriptional regulator [Shewanella sp. A32]|uniref:helix-turn-helix transcriptional regulator n=1 Tax=Shewanella sp. A32 TaxID=3031327 RepID=UPI0023B94FD9|nr:helix-turn-helix transcriptional regulator [Shewanella sp. A32]MDF0535748.1 helix-turn-helix transcriptional regulator [Shewanella sp. A32]
MPKSIIRTYSRYTEEAIDLLAKLIRAARLEKKMTTVEVAERAGISRGTLSRIEKADPKCEIGTVFEVAKIVGVSLFDANPRQIAMHNKYIDEKLSLLPMNARKVVRSVDDDF